VTAIVSNYNAGLEDLDFEAIRQLSVEVRKQGLALTELSSHVRLYNFIRKSGASEDKIESLISNVSSSDLPPEKIIELVNQLFEISKEESIPLDQVPSYINQKLEEKQKIEEEIKEADTILEIRM
jgi:hypothetical protein